METLINELFVKSNNINQNMTLVERSNTGDILIAKISTNISQISFDEYVIRITEFYSRDDNYSFKVEILKQFSKYLKKVEKDNGVMFTEIRLRCRNTDMNQSRVNIRLIQKIFAPLVFEKFAVFFFDNNNNESTLTRFLNKQGSVGNMQIVRKA